MSRLLLLLLRKIYKSAKSQYSLINADKMSDCDNTCKQKEKVSVTEDTGSLKRSIQDDDNIEEDASNKRAKTTERADEVCCENSQSSRPN